MKMKIKILAVLALMMACQHNNDNVMAEEIARDEMLKIAEVNTQMTQRAEQFRKTIHANRDLRSGVYVYATRSIKDYIDNPEKLAARLALLGFDDIYLCSRNAIRYTSKPEYLWVARFNRAAHSYGMKVYAVTLSNHKTLYSQSPDTEEMVNEIHDFNAKHPTQERLDGISADLEPHIMKAGRDSRPEDLVWEWDTNKNLGIGRDNDMLLKMTLDVLAEGRRLLDKKMPLSEAVAESFQRLYDNGDVAHGSAQQFLKSCDWLIVMAYSYRPQRVVEWATPYLKNAADKPRSISIAIKTSLNGVGPNTTSFMPDGWDKMVEGAAEIIGAATSYPSFRGLDIFEFQGFERMWDGSEPTEENRRDSK